MTQLSDVYKFIEQAGLVQCRDIAATLSSRLFVIDKQYFGQKQANINEAAHLVGDALLDLSKAVERKEEENLLCAQCNGSGEGRHERTSCYFCKGRGTV